MVADGSKGSGIRHPNERGSSGPRFVSKRSHTCPVRIPPSANFRYLLAGGIVSQLGDWAARLALALLVFQRTDSAAAVGLLSALLVLPWLGLGQYLSTWGDRIDRRRLLVLCDVARGAIFLVIGFSSLPIAGLLALVFLAATIDPVFEANKAAMVVDVVPKADYPEAIQMIQVVSQTAQLVGFGLGGVLAAALTAEGALALNGVTFGLSAVLLSRVSGRFKSDRSQARPSLNQATRFLRDDPISRIAVIGTFLTVACAMSVESQAAVFGSNVAGLGETGVGLLAACVPASTLACVSLIDTAGTDKVLLKRGAVVSALGAWPAIPLLILGSEWQASFAAFLLVGTVFTFSTVGNIAVGRRIPADIRAGTFAVLQASVFLAVSTGSFLGGLLAGATTSEVAAVGAMVVATGAAVGSGFVLDRISDDGVEL